MGGASDYDPANYSVYVRGWGAGSGESVMKIDSAVPEAGMDASWEP